MIRNKMRPASFKAISTRVIALAFALWFSCCALFTWAVAADFYRQLYKESLYYVRHTDHREFQYDDYASDLPGSMEADSLRFMGVLRAFLSGKLDPLLPFVLPSTLKNPISSDDWIWGKWDLLYGMELAEVYRGEDGAVLMKSGNYLTFPYTSKENWENGGVTPIGRAYVDLDAAEGGVAALEKYISDFDGYSPHNSYFLPVLRLSGYFEGNQFCPTAIDRGILRDPQAGLQQLNQLDRTNRLKWEPLLSGSTPEGKTLETIYAWDIGSVLYDSKAVAAGGQSFNSLVQLLEAAQAGDKSYSRKSLLDAVIIHSIQQKDGYGTFTYSMAIRCQPLQYAALRLWPFYLVSFGIIGLLVLLLLRRVRRSLTMPLEYMVHAAVNSGGTVVPSAPWSEPRALEEHFAATYQAQAQANATIQQLRTSLDYAKDAENRRRQLISNITHELKTPLAVVHSYAEGLQAGISREKQEEYLSVILEETEHMDTMVLQMLDLSRLEAGKVKLSTEAFSLLRLSREITDKFTPLLEAKALQLRFDEAEDFLIAADEARIGQVITNFISNALKYTPEGGHILIKVYQYQKEACFSIINSSAPLSEDALDKVWDSFYRADPARTEAGTGLGLTITKSIVELHRGNCYVRNTTFNAGGQVESGVAFGFTLPMG